MFWYTMLDPRQWVIFMALIAIVGFAQIKVMTAMAAGNMKENTKGLTGYQVARKILDANGLNHVEIEEVQNGDHYDPRVKKVRLSSQNYHQATETAMAVAAHEVGHAIQHDKGYVFLKLRSAIAPVVQGVSSIGWLMVMVGMFMFFSGEASADLIMTGVFALGAVVIFQVVTLPVEYNASTRAVKQLEAMDLIGDNEQGIKNVLSAAALTYVAALFATILNMLRLVLIAQNRRR